MTIYRPPEGFSRYRLELSWHGAAFVGWQSQPGQRSVQDTLYAAVWPLVAGGPDSLGVCGALSRPVAAGRTDAGVHAEAMTVHIDVRSGALRPRPDVLERAINARLAPDLVVLRAQEAPGGFHARFSCTERGYVYRVLNTPTRQPLWEGRALHVSGSLDLGAMRRAAALLIGEHDFAAFATQEERRTVRRLHRLDVVDRQDVVEVGQIVEFHVAGESFLRHMVRGLVGTLLRVGAGKQAPEQVAEVLASRQRAQAGANAAPYGLYFSVARYPVRFLGSGRRP